MKLRKLHISHLHNDQPISIPSVGKGVHVVIGPNGSGKSSSALAIKGLLWPELLAKVSFPRLQSSWSFQGKELEISRKGASTEYLLDSERVNPPSLPPTHLASCFTVTLDDIFDGLDIELAEAVERDFAGGYDLKALRDSQLHSTKPRSRSKAANELQEKTKERRKTEAHQRKLLEQQAKLAEHSSEIEAIESNLQRAKHLEKALRRTRCQAERSALRDEAQRYLPAQSKFRGFEYEQYQELEKKAQSSREEIKKLKVQLHEARRGLETELISASTITSFQEPKLQGVLELLRSQEAELEKVTLSLSKKSARLKDIARKLPQLTQNTALHELGEKEVEQLAFEVREHEKLLLTQQAQARELATLEENERREEIEAKLRGLQKQRREYLSAQGLDSALCFHRGPVLTLWITAVALWSFLASSPELLRTSLNQSLFLGALLTLLTLSLVWSLLRRIGLKKKLGSKTEEIPACEPFSSPLEWMDNAQAKLSLQLKRSERAEDVSRLLKESQEQLSERSSKLQNLAHELCTSPPQDLGTLPYLVETLFEYQREARDYLELKEQHRSLQADYGASLTECSSLLAPFGLPAVAAYREAASVFAELQSAATGVRSAEAESRHLQQQLSLQQAAELEAEEKQTQLLSSLSLQPTQAALLAELAAAQDAYREGQRKIENLSYEIGEIEKELDAKASDLLTQNEDQLQAQLLSSRNDEARRDELLKTITEIQTEIRSTRESQVLAKALQAETKAKQKLENLYEQSKNDALASLLIDSVESEYRRSSLPEVLEIAQQHFLTFTQGCFSLLAADPSPDTPLGFRARNNVTEEVLSLEQLSRGTRTQLLLAARLAFARRHELKEPLPFIMDEVLNSSDGERFTAIAESLLRLSAAEDRQVIYFSSRPEDLYRWQQCAHATGEAEVSYSELVPEFVETQSLPPEVLQRSAIPKPEEQESYQEYVSRLNLPPVASHVELQAIHLAHLLESKSTLYNLLAHGIHRFGPLVLAKRAGSQIISDEAYGELRARADLMCSVAKAARLGKGKPLTPEVIVKQGLSENFTVPLIELLERVENDAEEFLSALKRKEVAQFRSSSVKKFEDSFLEEGYLSPLQPLSEDEARARVLSEVSPHLEKQRITPESFGSLFSELWYRFSDRRNS